MWMDHDDRPCWAESWDCWTGPPVHSPDDHERATKVRRTQADERTQRYLRRERRAEKYEEIELHLRQRVIYPNSVLEIAKCYKTIISRALSNREIVSEL